VICAKNFEDYFFFVTDVVSWAKERMLVGPGRGSAGGSLLCYLLRITTVDPLKFGTLFERFIDESRNDLPDIDIDFPDNRRGEVFTYLKEKYGADHVARLGTISSFGGKSAINAVARVCGIPFEAAREVGKWTEGASQGQVIPPKWVFDTLRKFSRS
jgi:DNA polymerase-3 subunit alpha